MTPSILISLPIEEFRNIISETVKEELLNFQPAPEKEKKYFTRKETAQLLHISLPTLNTRTKNGEIEANRIGNRLLYSEDAIEQALKSTFIGRRAGV